MSERRKIESESEARQCLAAVKASGMSLKQWAQSRGIDGRSLHAWQLNLERSSKTTGRARRSSRGRPSAARRQLVELVPAATSSSSRYVLRVGAGSLEFGDDFATETLRRVVEVLRSC